MLEFNHNSRPKSKKILENPIIKRKIKEIFKIEHYGKVLTIKKIDDKKISDGFELINSPIHPHIDLERIRRSGININIRPDYRKYSFEWVPF